MIDITANPTVPHFSRKQQLRQYVLLFFCDPIHADCLRLVNITHAEWKQLLHWLDTSGLALYFLDRLTERDLTEILPPNILARLQQSMAQNAERIEAMVVESNKIQLSLQEIGVPYAVLKGFSLCPISVPKPELRSQLDLDFLVSREHGAAAKHVLEENGYELMAISGRSWEFKAHAGCTSSLKDLYKSGKTRSAELHVENSSAHESALLNRLEWMPFRGISMPVLPPVDLFLGQALHLYKHLLSEMHRAAHLVEFRRHVLARSADEFFWHQVKDKALHDPDVYIRLGVVVQLTSLVMGKFAPEALTAWTADRLPAEIRLWLARHGHRLVLAGFPGSKLHLVLRKELEIAGVPTGGSRLTLLIPRRLPPAITHRVEGESLATTIRRNLRELRFIAFRFRFHTIEGARYLLESALWRQHKSRLIQ